MGAAAAATILLVLAGPQVSPDAAPRVTRVADADRATPACSYPPGLHSALEPTSDRCAHIDQGQGSGVRTGAAPQAISREEDEDAEPNRQVGQPRSRSPSAVTSAGVTASAYATATWVNWRAYRQPPSVEGGRQSAGVRAPLSALTEATVASSSVGSLAKSRRRSAVQVEAPRSQAAASPKTCYPVLVGGAVDNAPVVEPGLQVPSLSVLSGTRCFYGHGDGLVAIPFS